MVPFTKQPVVTVEDMEENPFMTEFVDKRIKAGLAAHTKKIVPQITAMVTAQIECASQDIYARLDALDGKGGPPRITQPTIEDAPEPVLGEAAEAGPRKSERLAAKATPPVTTAEDITTARAAMSNEARAAD